ncbi:EPTC-inducible aldehyde dehydrogenase [Tatumella ptyseos]|uniref:EPTC-inducible aldehyde dehydrogenase n=1 Tax=Tatumella ptyseos TaxID=82987 RepID=A0A2X5NG27_9GAMM|nr:EPTC-inducible aldehyde dehydrogenase [Tatumella ptyseos]
MFNLLVLGILIERAGAPKGLVNIVAGYGHTIGQSLIAKAPIRKVVFVGSPATGRHIAVAAAQRCIPAVLELGGNRPILFLMMQIGIKHCAEPREPFLVGQDRVVFPAPGYLSRKIFIICL